MEIKEVWKDIRGYEGLYQVSNLGRVKSLNYKRTGEERILKITKDRNGYYLVNLRKNNKTKMFKVHYLVADNFIPNPYNKPEIDHINTNPSDNRVENLRWATREENCNNELTRTHNSESKKIKNNGIPWRRGKDNPYSKKIVQLSLSGELIRVWDSIREAEREEGFDHRHICKCCKGKQKFHKEYKWMYYEDYIKQGEMNDENI